MTMHCKKLSICLIKYFITKIFWQPFSGSQVFKIHAALPPTVVWKYYPNYGNLKIHVNLIIFILYIIQLPQYYAALFYILYSLKICIIIIVTMKIKMYY